MCRIGLALITFSFFSCSESTNNMNQDEKNEMIRVGALLDLSGDDIAIETALEIRSEMINNMLDELYSNAEVVLLTRDTDDSPVTALQQLQDLKEDSVVMVIGPITSAELEHVTDYANENEIVLISPSSTAPSLAIPNDYVLRFCPNDVLQSKAISTLMWEDGKKYLITVYRDDNYGNELEHYISVEFINHGGQVANSLSYNISTIDLSMLINNLSNEVENAKANYNTDEIGIVLIGFEESADILASALGDTTLTTIHWYGSDGNSLDNGILEDPTTLQVAEDIHFTASTFGREEDTDVDDIIINEIIRRTGNDQVSMSAIYAYDALYTFFLAYTRVHENDGSKILREFPLMTQAFYGASGWVELDENGDRIYGDYDFWSIEESHWVKTARFEINRGDEQGSIIRIP